MADEAFRYRTITLLDRALAKWMVTGEYREFLSALRLYVPVMPDIELEKFKSFMPVRGEHKTAACEYPQEVKDAAAASAMSAFAALARACEMCNLVGVCLPDDEQ